VRRHDRVALCLPRTPAAIVAILGALKADAAYVPLDPKSPAERQAQVVGDCRPAAIVCDAQTAAATAALVRSVRLDATVVCLDDAPAPAESGPRVVGDAEIAVFSGEPPASRGVDADLAYVLYTSGSTGRPKGVMVTHRNVLDYAGWAVDQFRITAADRVFATAPFHFDMSTFDVFAALHAGARLCVVPESFPMFPPRLLDYLEREGATLWKTVPSLFLYMARTGGLKPGRMPTLTRMLFGGEVLHPRNVAEWMRLFPEKSFYNVYGPTEATGVSLFHAIETPPPDGEARVPIGVPCTNTDAFVLRPDGTRAEAGETGELFLRGAGVAAGYWGDADTTARVFVDNPLRPGRGDRVYRTGDLARQRPDGAYEFLGRVDEQVKYMGYRISTADVEAALMSLPGVEEAAVFLDERSGLVVPELVGLVHCAPGRAEADLARELGRKLPAYMVPKRVVAVPTLPRTDRGKIARRELAALVPARAS
jgi:amino acid adenylation domain-containing protein